MSTTNTSKSTPEPPTLQPDSQIDHAASLTYWNSISADVNGMLGGYPQVSRIDLQGSKSFIAKVRRLAAKSSRQTTTSNPAQEPPTKKLRLGVDCGAGIGRITSGLLIDICDTVDIVEPISKFASVLSSSPLSQEGRIGDVYVQGLEAWQPEKQYDLIWNQWCVGHLTDAQLTAYLRRAGAALALDRGAWMCVKENLSTQAFGEDLYDEVDSSVTRSDAKFRSIFEDAGLEIIKAEVQTGFPKGLGLFPVKMYALRPKSIQS